MFSFQTVQTFYRNYIKLYFITNVGISENEDSELKRFEA